MNVQEVLQISRQRKTRIKEIIKKITENIHKKIKHYAMTKREECVYMVPSIIDDFPIYDLEYVIKEIYKILDSEGFIVTAYPDGKLYICWNEDLVSKKVKTDAMLLQSQEQKLLVISKKNKQLNDRFSMLANPAKVKTTKSIDDEVDQQIEKILKEKEKQQKKFSSMLGSKGI